MVAFEKQYGVDSSRREERGEDDSSGRWRQDRGDLGFGVGVGRWKELLAILSTSSSGFDLMHSPRWASSKCT
jgi:hypothetical protein